MACQHDASTWRALYRLGGGVLLSAVDPCHRVCGRTIAPARLRYENDYPLVRRSARALACRRPRACQGAARAWPRSLLQALRRRLSRDRSIAAVGRALVVLQRE